MRRFLTASLILIGFASLTGCSNLSSTPTTATLDLQEKCSNQARIFFNDQKNEVDTWDYQNHYNKNLNKCFILITQRFGDGSGVWRTLYNVLEHTEYAVGSFDTPNKLGNPINYCTLIDKTKDCNSAMDFNAFIKTYMEE